VAVVALDALPPRLLAPLAQRYPSTRVLLDDADAIDGASLRQNRVLERAIRQARDMGGRLHLIGLISDAGIHASFADLERGT
jgi:bisphosphoglycerate-independent phosphoglycerate mutase (AlkP superfamily)